MTERRFPPLAMTNNSTDMSSAPYGKGTYEASASSEYNGKYAYEVFDHKVDNGQSDWEASFWHTRLMRGDPEWVRLDLPVSVRLTRYVLCSRQDPTFTQTDFPNSFELQGSNDGSSWAPVDSRSNQAKLVQEEFTRKEYSINVGSSFTKYRLYVFDAGPDGKGRGEGEKEHVVLSEFELYGVIENGAPNPEPVRNPRPPSDGGGFPTWAIVLIIVAVVALIAAMAFLS